MAIADELQVVTLPSAEVMESRFQTAFAHDRVVLKLLPSIKQEAGKEFLGSTLGPMLLSKIDELYHGGCYPQSGCHPGDYLYLILQSQKIFRLLAGEEISLTVFDGALRQKLSELLD